MRSPGRIRKRTFVVTGLAFLAVLLTGSLVILYAVATLGPADLIRFGIEEGQERSAILGSGISLNAATSANLVQDASFEPLVFRQALTLYGGNTTTLTVSSEEASGGLYGDGFFNQAQARIMTLTNEGLVLKKTAQVTNFGINRIGVFQPVLLPGDLPDHLALKAFARLGDLSIGVGEEGLIIRNITGQMPEIVDSGLMADLTGITSDTGGFLACSDSGDLLASPDGRNWQRLETTDHTPLRAVAASDRSFQIAVGDKGTVIAIRGNQTSKIRPLTQSDLLDVAYGRGQFVAVGRRGVVLTSKNGLVWQAVNLAWTGDWLAVDFRDGRFVAVGRDGAVAICDEEQTFTLQTGHERRHYVDVVMLSRQQMILLDDSGAIVVTNDSGLTWQQSGIETGMHSRVLALAGKDKVISSDETGRLGIAQLVAEIQLDSPLKDGQYQAGDLVFLEKSMTELPAAYLAGAVDLEDCASPWTWYGSGSFTRTTEDAAPGGGTASLFMQCDSLEKPAILSQVIDGAALSQFRQNEVLQISVWMRQSQVVDRQVQVWLSGSFEPVGATLTNVGTTWKKYTFAVVLPNRPGGLASQDIRLNFAIASGSVWIDRVFLGSATEADDLLSTSLTEAIRAIEPQVIRLDMLGIGSRSVLTETWAKPLGNDSPQLFNGCWDNQVIASLHSALTLASQCGADPWLVVDTYASQAELLNLIEFIAGSISEPFGKLRQEQGRVIPWTEQFQRIFIEIRDSYGVLGSDTLRSDLVNLMIRTISQSPYYRQIRSKLVFVDGMIYTNGVMLSTADYHASDLAGQVYDERNQAVDAIYQAYLDQIPRNPEKPAQNWPELIRTVSLRSATVQPIRLADLVDLALCDLGGQSGLANLALPAISSKAWQPIWPAAAKIVSAAVRGIPLQVSEIRQNDPDIDPDSQSGHEGLVRAYAFSNSRTMTVTLTNRSSQPVTCQLATAYELSGAVLEKYDENGTLLSREVFRRNTAKITLLPGGTALLVKDVAAQVP
jgi:hypothetical protein